MQVMAFATAASMGIIAQPMLVHPTPTLSMPTAGGAFRTIVGSAQVIDSEHVTGCSRGRLRASANFFGVPILNLDAGTSPRPAVA